MNWDPNPNDVRLEHFEEAVRLAGLSKSEEGKLSPKVGVVVIKDGQVLSSAHRHMTGDGDHAEYVALEERGIDSVKFVEADLITTLEPCTEKRHGKMKKPCVEWIKLRRIRRVWIGVLDENPSIRGKALSILREAGIHVQLFPEAFVPLIEEQNKEFFEYIKSKQPTISEEKKEHRWEEVKQLFNEFITIFGDDTRWASYSYLADGRHETLKELSRLNNTVYGMDYRRIQDWNELGNALLTVISEWGYQYIQPPHSIAMHVYRTYQEIAPRDIPAAIGRARVFIQMGEVLKASTQLDMAKEILVKKGKTGKSNEAFHLFHAYLRLAGQLALKGMHESIIQVLWWGLEVVDAKLVKGLLTTLGRPLIENAINTNYSGPVPSEAFIGVSRKLLEIGEHDLAMVLEDRAATSSE